MRLQALALVAGLLQAGLVKAQLAYANNTRPLRLDPDNVAALFPDVPNVKLLSPAFTDPRSVPAGFALNTEGPTDITTLDKFLRGIAKRNDWATYNNDLKSEEGRPIPYLHLSSKRYSRDRNGTNKKLRIWLQGGVHGNEPAGDQGLLALLGKLDSNSTWTKTILAKADIIVLPRYNADGVAYFQRYYATSFDPNRDQVVLKSKQSRAIKSVLSAFDPHIFLDAHEFTSGLLGAEGQFRTAQDLQYSVSKNQNIHKSIRALGDDLFVGNIGQTLEKYGLRHSDYFTSPSYTEDIVLSQSSTGSRSNGGNAALFQSIGILTEARGILLGSQQFQRRATASLLAAETIVQTAVDNFDTVYNTIENARKAFIKSTEDIIVRDTPLVHQRPWEFVDARNGTLVTIPVTFRNNTAPTTLVTRRRPEAYVFSRAWSEVAELLRISGVEVEELKRPFEGTVEALRVTSAVSNIPKYEGIVETTVQTEAFEKQIRIPAGGYRVSTRQKNAAFALVTLEPENSQSYAAYNIINLNQRDEYPVYRIL